MPKSSLLLQKAVRLNTFKHSKTWFLSGPPNHGQACSKMVFLLSPFHLPIPTTGLTQLLLAVYIKCSKIWRLSVRSNNFSVWKQLYFFLSRWRLISWTLLFLFHRNLLQYLHVTAGEHDLRLKESSEQTPPVKSVIQHPKSDPRTPMNYDVALLKLDGTLNFSKARVSCDLLLHEEKVIVLCMQKINCQYEINFTDSTKITILFFGLKTPKHL